MLRTKFLTAGVASRVLKKGTYGAGGYGSVWQLLRWYLDEQYRINEQKKLDENEHCRRGREQQGIAAAAYSEATGFTLAPLGFLKGGQGEEAKMPAVPDFLSVTYDYVCLEAPVIVEVKCPVKEHEDWKEKYWVQCQHQLQIARFDVLHLAMFFPGNEHEPPRISINEIKRDDKWFTSVVPRYNVFWATVQAYSKDESVDHYVEKVRKYKIL
jgi:hypothetical protein